MHKNLDLFLTFKACRCRHDRCGISHSRQNGILSQWITGKPFYRYIILDISLFVRSIGCSRLSEDEPNQNHTACGGCRNRGRIRLGIVGFPFITKNADGSTGHLRCLSVSLYLLTAVKRNELFAHDLFHQFKCRDARAVSTVKDRFHL